MQTKKTVAVSAKVAGAQKVTPTQSNDLFAMFQAFMAQTQAQSAKQPAKTAEVPAKAGKPAKASKKAGKSVSGVHVHELANSFFVYGEGAEQALAGFLAKKPHLNRGFKEREIAGIGRVKAYWFGNRQRAKIDKLIAK